MNISTENTSRSPSGFTEESLMINCRCSSNWSGTERTAEVYKVILPSPSRLESRSIRSQSVLIWTLAVLCLIRMCRSVLWQSFPSVARVIWSWLPLEWSCAQLPPPTSWGSANQCAQLSCFLCTFTPITLHYNLRGNCFLLSLPSVKQWLFMTWISVVVPSVPMEMCTFPLTAGKVCEAAHAGACLPAC